MKHGTLVAAMVVSILTCCQPLPTQAGGKAFSLKLPSGGGGGGGGWSRPNPGGGGWNRTNPSWSRGNWGGGGYYNNYNGYNYQTYPDPNSYNQYQQYPANNGATTQQYAAPVTQDYSTPALQPNSVPTVQSNSVPSVTGNTVATYKPLAPTIRLQVVPMMATAPSKPASLGASTFGATQGFGPSGSANPSSKWNKNGKGGKGKSAFAIIGGQLTQIFSSDDGNSWVTADPGTADSAVADDSQTPPSVDLAGQNPMAAITLLNPLETRSPVNFNLGLQNGSLQPGYAAQATASDPQLIVFDRGGAFGQAQYTLTPGAAYRFTATSQGWDLRTVTQ